ncbi:simple sugar transport system permease protein/ribose transport system permease protein [Evansella caseinilytica]|uniref:Simple sugar transport system permease protein/ribose transport system permease protein n=1 Tax=Evansella caseinilytica TaxID=1503961 RepID=A0A1H3H6X7_9BACI|nr:ABC transporter permease [Evansella caseinilytica]SDY11272.1 simple sugar transport system permease protein/ribose transport system permease protein [Evansella caseinilytica]
MKLLKTIRLSKENTLGFVLLGMFLLMALFVPNFLSAGNIKNMMFQLPEFGILSLAMMVVIITSGIDLSLTYRAALSGVIIAMALSAGAAIPVAIMFGLLAAVLCGLLNGFFIAIVGVSPILITLGSMILFESISLGLTKGNSVSGFPPEYRVIGNGAVGAVPISLLIFLLVAVITAMLLNRTKWGRGVYMAGSNPVATLFSGINTKRVLLLVYLYGALLTCVAAVIMTSRYNSARVDLGSSYLLQSVAAAVLGGTNIQGGYGKVIGTVYAVGIFQLISSGLNLLGTPRTFVSVLMGVILILVLMMNYYYDKLADKKETAGAAA